MKKAKVLIGLLSLVLAAAVAVPLYGHEPSGAIFTTNVDGTEVNQNKFETKPDVYLDGGPGPGAPQHAAGLDDGTYVFQITNPDGHEDKLLSTDPAKCRQFTVAGGIITGVVDVGGCQHVTGNDVDHPPALTVQMFPFDDTPNPGGVYKAWITELGDFLAGCEALGVPNGLEVVDCGFTPGNAHGFVGGHHKTDNFKVKSPQSAEIDVQFFDTRGQQLDGLGIKWVDTVGARNQKWSYLVYFGSVHVAHVEAVEDGTHQIELANQTGCTIGTVKQNGRKLKSGPQTVFVKINNGTKNSGIYYYTVNFEVTCTDQ